MFHSLLEIRKQLQQNITSKQLLEWQLPWSLSGVVLPPFCSYSLLYLCSPAVFHCSDHFHLTKMSHLLFSTTICRPLISNPPQTSLSTWAWLWGILPAFAICTCILSQSLKTVLITGEYIIKMLLSAQVWPWYCSTHKSFPWHLDLVSPLTASYPASKSNTVHHWNMAKLNWATKVHLLVFEPV